ncbi:MAG: trypsin-like peptidase domain-containing protein [Bacteroidota bacterium]
MKTIFYFIIASLLFTSCATIFTRPESSVSIRSNPEDATVYKDSTEIGTTSLHYQLDRGESHVLRVEKDGYMPEYICYYTNQANKGALFNALNLGWFYNFDIRHGEGAKWADAAQDLELYKKPDSVSNTQTVYFNKLKFDIPEEDTLFAMRMEGEVMNLYTWEKDEEDEEEVSETIEEYEGPMKWRNDDDNEFAATVNDVLRECGYNVPEEDDDNMFAISNVDYFLSGNISRMYSDVDMKFSFSEGHPIKLRSRVDIEWVLTNALQDTVETYPVSVERVYWMKPGSSLFTEETDINFDIIPKAVYEMLKQSSFVEHVSTELDKSIMNTKYDEPLALLKDMPVDKLSDAVKSVVTITTGEGHGSGCIVSTDGYILTNYHVIHGADSLEVRMANDSVFPADVIRTSEAFDLALVKIEESDLPGFVLDSTRISDYGQDVFSIGTGVDVALGQSLSKGIISGKRNIGPSEYLQTDVSINPGSSGGALVDTDGQLLGIVSAKMMGVGIEGIGFAIPIKTVIKSLNIMYDDIN